MSVLADVRTLLSGVSNVYIGTLPNSPDNAVSLYSTGGYPRSMSGSSVEEPTFQVRVRNTEYSAGEVVCRTVMEALHRRRTSRILMIQSQGPPLDLGRDKNNRPEWSLNFRCYYIN